MLEKLWHVVFGERAMMPPPQNYSRWSAEYVADAENRRVRVRLKPNWATEFKCLPNSTWR